MNYLDQINASATPSHIKTIPTPDYTIGGRRSEFDSTGTFKGTAGEFIKGANDIKYSTMNSFAEHHRGNVTANEFGPGSLRSSFGESIKRGSFPIESTTQPKGFLKKVMERKRERTSDSESTSHVILSSFDNKRKVHSGARTPSLPYTVGNPTLKSTATRAGTSQRATPLCMNYNLPDTQWTSLQQKLRKVSPMKQDGDGIGRNLRRPKEFLHE